MRPHLHDHLLARRHGRGQGQDDAPQAARHFGLLALGALLRIVDLHEGLPDQLRQHERVHGRARILEIGARSRPGFAAEIFAVEFLEQAVLALELVFLADLGPHVAADVEMLAHGGEGRGLPVADIVGLGEAPGLDRLADIPQIAFRARHAVQRGRLPSSCTLRSRVASLPTRTMLGQKNAPSREELLDSSSLPNEGCEKWMWLSKGS